VIHEKIVLVDASEDRSFLIDYFAVPRPLTHTPNFGRERQLRAGQNANSDVLSL